MKLRDKKKRLKKNEQYQCTLLKIGGVMAVFTILVVVTVSWLNSYTKTLKMGHFKYVLLFCKLYLNEAEKMKKGIYSMVRSTLVLLFPPFPAGAPPLGLAARSQLCAGSPPSLSHCRDPAAGPSSLQLQQQGLGQEQIEHSSARCYAYKIKIDQNIITEISKSCNELL